MASIIDQHSSHATIAKLQRSINRRGKHRGISIAADGEYGPRTRAAQDTIAHRLGVSPVGGSTKAVVHSQNIVRHPGYRSPAELIRATRVIRAWRKAEKAKAHGPAAAIRWAEAQVGTHEATGRNDGTKIHDWQRWVAGGGSYLDGAPYCGIGVCNACIRHSSVNATARSRWASVGFIEDDARAHRNGFTGWGSASSARPGDLVVLFGRGVHVELIVRRVPGGLSTVGFNTSSGNAGSQSNGGGVYRRTRPNSAVHGIAHVNY